MRARWKEARSQPSAYSNEILLPGHLLLLCLNVRVRYVANRLSDNNYVSNQLKSSNNNIFFHRYNAMINRFASEL